MTTTTKPLRRVAKQLTGWRDELGTPPVGLWGHVSPELRGDVSELWGDVSELSGDVSELSGDVSELSGDCNKIPHAARPCNISDWVQP